MLIDNSSQAIAAIIKAMVENDDVLIRFSTGAAVKSIWFSVDAFSSIDGIEDSYTKALSLLEENAHYITEVI